MNVLLFMAELEWSREETQEGKSSRQQEGDSEWGRAEHPGGGGVLFPLKTLSLAVPCLLFLLYSSTKEQNL